MHLFFFNQITTFFLLKCRSCSYYESSFAVSCYALSSNDLFSRDDVTFDKSDLHTTNNSFLHPESHKLFQFFLNFGAYFGGINICFWGKKKKTPPFLCGRKLK